MDQIRNKSKMITNQFQSVNQKHLYRPLAHLSKIWIWSDLSHLHEALWTEETEILKSNDVI